jgi:hypothetical protein
VNERIIYLQQAAPGKPPLGAPCNGCGVCCAVATCPLARVFLWQLRGPCRALEWDAGNSRYQCGMLLRPAFYVRALPLRAQAWFALWARRKIAAGAGCDASVSAHTLPE